MGGMRNIFDGADRSVSRCFGLGVHDGRISGGYLIISDRSVLSSMEKSGDGGSVVSPFRQLTCKVAVPR